MKEGDNDLAELMLKDVILQLSYIQLGVEASSNHGHDVVHAPAAAGVIQQVAGKDEDKRYQRCHVEKWEENSRNVRLTTGGFSNLGSSSSTLHPRKFGGALSEFQWWSCKREPGRFCQETQDPLAGNEASWQEGWLGWRRSSTHQICQHNWCAPCHRWEQAN